MSLSTFILSQIQRLDLARNPAGKEIATVQRLLGQLGSDSYYERVSANRKLLRPEIGAKYRSMLLDRISDKDFEVRYRVRQILFELKDLKNEFQGLGEFDRVTLNQKTSTGDAGDFCLACRFRGKAIEVCREDVVLIRSSCSAVPHPHAGSGPIEVTVFSDFRDEFFQANQTLIDFEHTPTGKKLKLGDEVTQTFVPVGLRFENQLPQRVGVSRFVFNYDGVPTRGQSACVVTSKKRYEKSFVGEMKFRFCMPGQESIKAGVHELGLFIARVNGARDFIMECYDVDDNVLGGVEASEGCAFMGIKSAKPIVRARIKSNPNLFRLNRRVDEDFAVDHLCFSKPVRVDSWAYEAPTVKLKQGDVLMADRIDVSKDHVEIHVPWFDQSLQMSWSEVAAIYFRRPSSPLKSPRPNRPGAWMAMLDDGSVLAVRPDATLTSELFEGLSFSPSSVVALWRAPNELRLPTATDFERGSQVLVFPTCRLAASDVTFSAEGYAWQGATLIEQQLWHVDQKRKLMEDPNPKLTSVQFSETSIQDTPTLWNHQPTFHDPSQGRISLTDGQHLMLATSNGFTIESFNSKSVTVKKNGVTQTLDWSRIASIRFPDAP